jgi:two-component system, OmpR family, phosphate regulon sensor histidine kinase PhoR
MSAAINRLWDNRWAIVAAAIVTLAFVLLGGLPAVFGATGLVVICAVVMLIANRPASLSNLNTFPQPAASEADWRRLQVIIDALPDPVVALDATGAVLALNAQARRIAPALRQGEPISLALRMPALIAAVRRAVATGAAQRVEFSERSRSEQWYEVHVIPAALSRLAGSPPDLLLTFHDLTQPRRIEQMRADFVANASHELRTPLAALSGFLETLRGSAQNDTRARERFLAIMHAQAERMARLIDDLLSLSRIELREHINPNTPVELLPIIHQVIDTLQARAHERGVEISVTPAMDPLVVHGERDELIGVFENLVENAIKYGASGKRVEIRLESTSGQVANGSQAKVSVRDYGPGIAPEHLPRLTERFYRVDVGQSRAEGGTGLGLALVKHILNRHGGRLSIESTLGAGSIFTVTLPLIKPAH